MEVGFVELLRASWVSGILPVLIALMPFSTLTPFRGLVLGFAKRGKIMQSSSRGYLREHKEESDKYMIPYGDWFEMVSSPHYLAEIVIYAGIVVASGLADLTTWLLFGFVVANLVFVAAETQRWYLEKFENYPKNRKAIIPFLY